MYAASCSPTTRYATCGWLATGSALEPVPGADTVVDGGFLLPGLVDAHCHLGIAPGGRPITSLEQARLSAVVDRDAGVLAIRDAGSPFPYPELDGDAEMPRLARAGRHLAPPRRYLPKVGRGGHRRSSWPLRPRQAAAGQRLGQAGRRLDRPGRGRPRTHLRARRVGRRRRRGPRRRGAGRHPHVQRGGGGDAGPGRGRLGRARHRPVHRGDRRDGPPGHRAGTHDDQHRHLRRASRAGPRRSSRTTPSTWARWGPASRRVVRAAYEAGRADLRRFGRRRRHRARPGRRRRCFCCTSGPAWRRSTCCAAGSWGARAWLGFPGLVEGGLADLVVYDRDPRVDLRVLRSPGRIVLRGRVVREPAGGAARADRLPTGPGVRRARICASWRACSLPVRKTSPAGTRT